MTFTANDRIVGPVTPAAAVTLISIDFYFESETELEVFDDSSDTALTLGVDYTVAECSAPEVADGSITLTVAADGSTAYTIRGAQPLERTSDLQFRGDLRSPVLNLEFDRLWRAITDVGTDVARSFGFSQTTTVPGKLNAGVPADRGNKLIKFSADGTDLELSIDVTDLTTLTGLTAEIAALAALETELTALGAITADITATAGLSTEITALAGLTTEIAGLYAIRADISTVAGISANVTTVAGIAANVTTVAGINANVTTVAGISGNVTTVAGIAADVSAVAADAVDIGVVAGLAAEIAAVAADAADIGTVAADSADIGTLASISADISALASGTGGVLTGNWTASGIWSFTSTAYLGIPRGTTAQRGSPAGSISAIRYNITLATFEGWDGSAWGAIGGGGGGGLFKGENGEVGSAPGDIFRINEQTLNTSVTIDADENASATGPLAIASGVTLTVTSGGNLSIV